MLAVVFLAACVWWGFGLLRICGVDLKTEERAVAGSVLGVATGTYLLYLLAAGAGGLSPAVLLGASALLGGGAALSRLRRRPSSTPVPGWFAVLAAGLAAGLLVLNGYGVLAHAGGNVLAVEHVWADLPFHLSITTSFMHRANIPPTYPLALGEPLGYPFLVDFLTAALAEGGLGLRLGVLTVNIGLGLAFFCGVAVIAHRLTRSPRTAVLAAVVLFLLGNLGWLAVPEDVRAAGGPLAWLRDVPWSYTGDALGDKGRERLGTGLYLGNPTFMFVVPRRAGTFGLAAAAALLLLFDDLLERRRWGTAVAAGLLLGLLPRIHAHTAIAAAVFALVWTVTIPVREGRPFGRAWLGEWRRAAGPWLAAGAVALAVALPQLPAILGQSEGFADWWFGWTGEPHQAAEGLSGAGDVGRLAATTVWFWVLNGGLLTLLLVPALWRADRRLRLWYAPFAVLWVLGNVVRTQPWEWDNSNYFVYWQWGTTVVVAALLARWTGAGALRRVAAGAAVAALTVGGLLSFAYAVQHRQHLWTEEEAAFAREVREHTPEDAVVLTSNGHTHPVTALAGRQTYMGFPGWFVAHGLDWERYEAGLRRMYAGDVRLMRRLGVDYVVVGPWERGPDVTPAPVFEDPDVFAPVLSRDIAGRRWELLRLRP